MTRTTLLSSLLLAGFSGGLLVQDARAQNLTTEVVAQLTSSVTDIQSPPGDLNRVFLVRQVGVIRVLQNGALVPGPFLDVNPISACCGERGLLGLAFHPDFANNGRFFINYSDNSGATQVVEYHVPGNPMTNNVADPTPVQTIFSHSQPFSNHNGGCIQFGPDGKLYVGMGDGGSGNDPGNRAQNINNSLGKMLRFDVDIAAPFIPADNPFVGVAGNDEIWAIGLRNPWRFSFDFTTNELWIADVGQNAKEEINAVPAGASGLNYGWRCMEGFNCTGLTGCTCGSGSLTAPVLDYTHGLGCSVTGGYVYRGSAIPSIQGKYFYADYCSSRVWSVDWDGTTASNNTDLTADLSGNGLGLIQTFGEDGNGELYMGDGDGTVVRIIPSCGPQYYCQTAPNSVGSGGTISAIGSYAIADNNFLLSSVGLPLNQFGLYYYGPEQIQVPFGDGFRCVGDGATGVFRVEPPTQVAFGGELTRQLDFNQPPANGGPGMISAGSTWNFQLWYRDPGGPGGTNFNLTDAASVLFCP